jgi:raffinose/stachyose/melibiose transport system substrate-binding protein
MSRNWPGGPEGAAETLVRIPFPPSDLGAGGEITAGGSDGWVLREGAPEPALDLLERLAGLEVQTELARLGHLVPSIAGADDAISDPAIAAVATDLTLSRYHQLFLDQVLGPQAGEKLNDVAVALADGDLTPEAAASEIEAAWSDARATLTIGAEPALPEPVE